MVYLNLGLAGFGHITGLKLLAVSVVVLIRDGSTGPFTSDDLSFIAIGGLVMMLVTYRTVRRNFRKGRSSVP
jgi:hypothetical protein